MMMDRRNFIVLFIVLVSGMIGWYSFVYVSLDKELQDVSNQLNELTLKVGQARRAEYDIRHIESRLSKEKLSLEQEKNRFIRKGDLSAVTEKMRQLAQKHDITVLDFSPSFENYFENNLDTKITALPIDITISGKYLDIGKYMEDWDSLQFYIFPSAILIETLGKESNLLKAKISTKLYIWNN